MPTKCEIFCEILIAILLPPLGVCLRHGCCTRSIEMTIKFHVEKGEQPKYHP
ncbi:hypothetical protein SAY86_031069 [Trapa natans]|uniref:Uncharacterized protein n=1 Tax=Trapa natans TaxID=22666 RepID=A0AAN7MTL6_TRANT|nr:hypothetical protein SAY86_031069 [Trapa natans]